MNAVYSGNLFILPITNLMLIMVRKKIQKVKDKAQETMEKHLLPPDPGFRRRAGMAMCVR